MPKRTTGSYLNELWGVGAAHALYIHDGHWYHKLKRFPGALFDRNGYVVFTTKKEFLRSPHLKIARHVHIRKPGISSIPGYVQVIHVQMPTLDVDIHKSSSTGVEGRRRLIAHLQRERNQSLVRKKKREAESLHCEVCGFSFIRAYGKHAEAYCEVHHLIPLAEADEIVTTRLEDLAILCANCHRVVHLRYPPYRLEEVKSMLRYRKSPDSNYVR